MLRRLASFVPTLVLTASLVSSASAIQKVAPRWGFIEATAGYALPVGSYDGVFIGDFTYQGRSFDIDAEDVYDGGFGFGLAVGTLRGGHFQASIGFGYAQNEIHNPIDVQTVNQIVEFSWTYGGGETLVRDLTLHQYDIDLNLNYLFMDITRIPWSPYVGLGLHGGLSGVSARDVETEWDGDAALSLNFGAEVRLYSGPGGRTFLTLVSDNNWDFVSTSDRPRYLQINGGFRYYFKP